MPWLPADIVRVLAGMVLTIVFAKGKFICSVMLNQNHQIILNVNVSFTIFKTIKKVYHDNPDKVIKVADF